MKFQDTEFARQMLSAILGLLLLVATVAFVTLPAPLSAGQDGSQTSAAQSWHLT